MHTLDLHNYKDGRSIAGFVKGLQRRADASLIYLLFLFYFSLSANSKLWSPDAAAVTPGYFNSGRLRQRLRVCACVCVGCPISAL